MALFFTAIKIVLFVFRWMPEDENHHVVDEWERLGLDKRIDYENLKRVFERLDLKVVNSYLEPEQSEIIFE